MGEVYYTVVYAVWPSQFGSGPQIKFIPTYLKFVKKGVLRQKDIN
jgi:hypothetical protein